MLGHPRRIRHVSQLDVALEIVLDIEQRLLYAAIRDHVFHSNSSAGSSAAYTASTGFQCKGICSWGKGKRKRGPNPWSGKARHGFGAEIHLFVQSHGKYVVGSVDLQIGDVAGGCAVNDCTIQQVIMFAPIPPGAPRR